MTRRPAVLLAFFSAIAGLGGTVIAAHLTPALFPHAWLAAVATWAGWPLGCMGLIFIHTLTGGEWGYALRPQLLAGTSTLALLPLALIPLIFVAQDLYPWLRPDVAAQLENRFYLNLRAFVERLIAYLVIWLALGALIFAGLRRGGPAAKLRLLAPLGLILLAVTITFAAIDATMSLEPHFASSSYGLIAIAGMGLFALSISVFSAAAAEPPGSKILRNFGRLLLALVVLWAYLDFVQFLIIWQSDLPSEAPWYLVRSSGGWGAVAAAVAAGHFFLPFFILLSAKAQETRAGIACASGLLILSAMARGWWLVIPASGRAFGAIDALAMLGVAGIAALFSLLAGRFVARPQLVRGHV